jgi:iron complex outermembrane receptor protein
MATRILLRLQRVFCLGITLGLFPYPLFAQTDTSRATFEITLEPVTITARRLNLSAREVTIDKEALYRMMEQEGVGLIRRGMAITSDLYLRGFKRGEVEVTIDGERFFNACPNRMDPPLVRLNPLEMAAVRIDPSSLALQSGLGGQVAYQRRSPTQAWTVSALLQSRLASESSFEGALTASGQNHRLSLRWLTPRTYATGHGKSFGELYGYRELHVRGQWLEASLEGRQGAWQYGGGFFLTRDVAFPYLMMDERDNQLGHGFVAYKRHRLYANYSWHLMNNGLRSNASMMPMETDARTLTVGLTGTAFKANYELFYRFWKAENTMGSMMPMKQAAIPSVQVFSAAASRTFRLQQLLVSGRVGLSYFKLRNTERLAFFRMLYPEAQAQRWFVPFALGVAYRAQPNKAAWWGLQAELASEAPQVEQLYFGLRRMMGQPHWAGNPTLTQPVRTGLEATAQWQNVGLRLYGNHVWNYVYLERRQAQAMNWQTYRGVRALLWGGEARLTLPWGWLQTGYTWGENLTNRSPLAEIQPWTIQARVQTPEKEALHVWATATYHTRQGRVDRALQETPTPSWYRLDLGVRYRYQIAELRLEVFNVLDRTYRQHLSYVRNPYAAGRPVYEPGRTFAISLMLQR